MDPQDDQSSFSGPRIDSSFEIQPNVMRSLAAEIGGSLNTATDALLGAYEPLRSHSDTEPLLAPLDDILKDIYDIKTSFTPTSNSSLPCPMVSNSNQEFLPNFTSPTRNLSYGNYINNDVSYEGSCPNYGMLYIPSAGQNFVSSQTVPISMSVPPTTQLNHMASGPEEDNDQSPVYLNFNIGAMPAPNASFQKYQQPSGPAMDSGNYPENLRCMEYLNENGETARAKFFDNSAKGFRDYRTHRQNTMNAMSKIQYGQPNIEGCSKYVYAAEGNVHPTSSIENPAQEVMYPENCFVMKQDSCENIPNPSEEGGEWTVVAPKSQTMSYSEEPDILICRPPLRTKRSVRENPQLSLQIDAGGGGDVDNIIGMHYIAVVDNSDVQIPIIENRSTGGRMKRKQELKTRNWEDEVSFEEPDLISHEFEGELYNKAKSSPICRTPVKKKKSLSEDMFVGKRKRKNSTPPTSSGENRNADDSDYRSFVDLVPHFVKSKASPPSIRDTYRTRYSERAKRVRDCGSARASSAEIIASSDSDLEDIPNLTSKSLKCPKCKKIFKTHRSLGIHHKRCEVPAETESDMEITMVEYLESEKDSDGAEEMAIIETSEGTTTVTVIEKIDESLVDKVESPKEGDRQGNEEKTEVEENPLRRSTRSLTNSIASRKLSEAGELKPGNSQNKMKVSKGACNSARVTRRKKSK